MIGGPQEAWLARGTREWPYAQQLQLSSTGECQRRIAIVQQQARVFPSMQSTESTLAAGGVLRSALHSKQRMQSIGLFILLVCLQLDERGLVVRPRTIVTGHAGSITLADTA